jgi:hypothetical protein
VIVCHYDADHAVGLLTETGHGRAASRLRGIQIVLLFIVVRRCFLVMFNFGLLFSNKKATFMINVSAFHRFT